MDRYATLRQGLLGAWCPSLGATGYILQDVSGNGRHGTLTNMGGQVNWVPSGGALSLNLDGSNDYVSLPTTVAPTTALTMATWIMPTAIGQNKQRVIETSGTAPVFILKCGTSSPFTDVHAFVLSGASQLDARTPTGVIALNTWAHIAATWQSGGGLAIYVNGVSQSLTYGSIATLTATLAKPPELSLGWLSTFNLYGSQRLDDTRIYNRALTASEVAILASRRGVGLLPQRTRRADRLGSQFWLRDGGTWKKATGWIKVGGVWTKATPKLNVSGTWK